MKSSSVDNGNPMKKLDISPSLRYHASYKLLSVVLALLMCSLTWMLFLTSSLKLELWKSLKNHEAYEICAAYPYPIRKKASGKIVSERIGNHGYYSLKLDGKLYLTTTLC